MATSARTEMGPARFVVGILACMALAFGVSSTGTGAQQMTSGRNVNVAGGPTKIVEGVPVLGDPYLQRQNEPSMACSSRNPLNCLAGANDYRRLNFPGVEDGKVTGDAWLGTFWTRDGGNTWRSTLLPGYFEDTSPLGGISPANPYEAAADPIVRPGTNGLFYYSGIAFNRGAITEKSAGIEGKDGVMFVARFIDDNNTQTLDTPFRYLGASPVAFSNSARFLDKPGMAVDIPRAGSATCTIPASDDVPMQSFPGGHVYVVYAAFMGEDNPHTKITFHRSTDCGETWSGKVMLSESSKINQSPTIAIEPLTGRVFVAWREFAADKNGDQIVVAVSNDLGRSFTKGVVAGVLRQADGTSAGFDQPTLPTGDVNNFRLFRTNTYPTMCVAGNGTAYVAWAHRGLGPLGEARIVYTTSADGKTWTTPVPVEPPVNDKTYNGHQFMPAAACGGDKVTLIWYDQRDDAIAVPGAPATTVFAPLLLDTRELTIPTRTLDVRAAHATAGQAFQPSVPVTRYPLGVYMAGNGPATQQLQFSLENLPLFGGGVVPFIGDYIDVAPATMFQPASAASTQSVGPGASSSSKGRSSRAAAAEPNGWVFNTTADGTPPFHAIWTDNRDVVAGIAGAPIDQTAPPCSPGTQAGSKNQNIYTARLSTGLVAGVLGNARPLGDDLRAFSVFVQNLTPHPKRVELRIANQPVGGGTASFIQFAPDPADIRFPFPLAGLTGDFAPTIAAFSTIARTVFVSGSGRSAIRVDVDEIITAGGTTTAGQQLFAMINPDPTNPAPLDPALRDFFNETHDSFVALSDITDYDLLNPNFLNPTFLNPTFLNPNFLNPNFLNPNFLNPTFLNPNFLNPNFLNPNFLNPTFLNPTFLNPTFLNPTFLNTTMTEITWDVSAEGNTSSSYLLALLSSMEFPESWMAQLLIYRTYLSPWGSGFDPATGQYNCGLGTSEQHDLLLDVLNPNFLNPTFLNVDYSNPNFLNTALGAEEGNATFSLSSADSATVVLRIAHDGTFQPSFVTAVTIPQAVDTADAAGGITTPSTPPPPLAFAVGPTMPDAVGGVAYTAALAVTGGTAPYTWTYEAPLGTQSIPPGMQLNTATGAITGTPTQNGSWWFQIQATDSSMPAQAISGWFNIVVNETLQVTTSTLARGTSGTPYSATLQATGGTGPYVWALAPGSSLPAGISLSATGILAGTTSAFGVFPFTVTVTDTAVPAQTATAALTLLIGPKQSFAVQPTNTFLGDAIVPAVAVQVLDGSDNPVPAATVTLALGSNPGDAALTGTTSAVTDATGVARFGGLRVTRAGTFTLVPTVVANVPGPASASFNVQQLTGSVTDPSGDQSPDLISGSVATDGGNLTVTVTFGAGFDPATTMAQFVLDTDQSAATGHPGVSAAGTIDNQAVGSEFIVNFVPNFTGNTPQRVDVFKYAGSLNQFSFVGTRPVTVLASGYTVTFPLSLLDNDDGQLNFKVTSSEQLDAEGGSTGIRDVMPDVGLAPGTLANTQIDAQQSVRSGPNVLAIGGDSQQQLSQSLTPTISGFLTEVRLPIVGGGTVVLEVRTVDANGGPTQTVLFSQSFTGAQILADPSVFKRLVLTTPVAVTAGNRVAIVVSSPDTASIWMGPVANFYGGGDYWFSALPNSGWVANGPIDGRYDLPFQVAIK